MSSGSRATVAAAICSLVGVVSSSAPVVAAASPASGGGPAPMWALAGHHIVCQIAFQRLTPAGEALVFAARAGDPDPGPTFYESCGWADSSRYRDHKATYEYHFMNVVVDDADELVMARDCANYDCVQLAIVRYARYLAMDPGNSESMQVRRANALKFLGHFVGDLHQPLHVGYAHDRGANDIYADWYDEADQRLHAIWDFHIAERMGYHQDPVATARRLADEISDAEAAGWEDFDVVGWSRESYEVVKSLVYDIPSDRKLGDNYYDRARAIVEVRMKQAGVRLAYLINSAATNSLAFPELFDG